MQDEMNKEAAEEILELPRRYTKEDLRRAYTNMARRFHPDAARRHQIDPVVAQRRMVEVNKANEVLRWEFAHDPDRVVSRGSGGISDGFGSVDWRAGATDDMRGGSDPWSFAADWSADEPPAEEPEPTFRSVLLGPVLMRILFVVAFAWLWATWFPLLPGNLGRFVPSEDTGWQLLDVSRMVAAAVYPTYLVIYEALSGNVSNLVREALNGLVSFVSGHYVDLRPKGSSFGCALYKLLRTQVYALLMLPLVLFGASMCMGATDTVLKVLWGIVTVAVGVDTLAACVHGGFINIWTTALAERVESRYLLIRAALLRRCGQW